MGNFGSKVHIKKRLKSLSIQSDSVLQTLQWPTNNVHYPLSSTQQLKLFNQIEVAELVIANSEELVIEEIPGSVMDAQKLLSFEPYLGLGEALVRTFRTN